MTRRPLTPIISVTKSSSLTEMFESGTFWKCVQGKMLEKIFVLESSSPPFLRYGQCCAFKQGGEIKTQNKRKVSMM